MAELRDFTAEKEHGHSTSLRKNKALQTPPKSKSASVIQSLQATSFITRAARVGFATKTYKDFTIFWFYKGYRIMRLTLPIKSAPADALGKDMQIILPLFDQNSFYSKWVTSITLLSETMRAAFFTKFYQFQLIGYNYQAEYSNTLLILRLGYSHSSVIPVPFNIFIKIDGGRKLAIFSTTARAAAAFAAKVASLRSPNPYTGKGLLPEFRTLRLKKKK